MPTPAQVIVGATAAAVIGIGAIGLAVASGDDDPSPQALAPAIAFEANFGTPADFYDRFDYGYSGINPLAVPDSIRQLHGDHSLNPSPACGVPTSLRDVHFLGTAATLDFSELFWWCAPTGESGSGHIMTGVDTFGYNIAWFSPKPTFTGITKVCWDVNATTMSGRKWTQVMFVGDADATRYPAGQVTYAGTPPSGVARGTGGFDLGYTSPDFRDPNGPTTRILPQGGTMAGLKITQGIFHWFQNQDTWTSQQIGWPGFIPSYHGGNVITDKATRYKTCIENFNSSQIRLTSTSPYGQRDFTFNGQIPQDARRVVFQDDNYDPPKDTAAYNPDVLTWHWDNIQVYTEGAVPPTTLPPPPTTTLPATTSTVPPSTTTSSTTTTVATTTTEPSTTTTEPSTTTTEPTTTTSTSSTTTTTTTTTVPDPCPPTFDAVEHAWCESVESRLTP